PSAHTKGRPTGKPTGPLKPGEYWWNPHVSPEGPVVVLVSLPLQTMHVYRNGILVGRSSVSSGSKDHQPPTGVFTILQKKKTHRSKKYDNAPMPNMQRLTWSGIAMHSGNLPGHPASHGCIRVTNDFAIRLWHLTKRGTRGIIAHEDTRPVKITNPQLFVPKPKAAPAPPESGAASLASNDSATGATPHAPPISNSGEDAKTANSASPGGITQKVVPISVFVSRQSSKLFVRKGFTPLFDVPIQIRNPAEPMGTHVFSAMEFKNEGTAIRWNVV